MKPMETGRDIDTTDVKKGSLIMSSFILGDPAAKNRFLLKELLEKVERTFFRLWVTI